MAHLIDKDSVLAEIDERIKAWNEYYDDMRNAECHELASGAYLRIYELKDFKRFIDTLEVEEVDLTEEIYFYIENSIIGTNPIYTKGAVSNLIEKTAKHFFELGLKVKQG